jgi:hypothetical protein
MSLSGRFNFDIHCKHTFRHQLLMYINITRNGHRISAIKNLEQGYLQRKVNNLVHCDHLQGTPNYIIKANYPISFLRILTWNAIYKDNLRSLGELSIFLIVILFQLLQFDDSGLFLYFSRKKRTSIIHTLANDTLTSSNTASPASIPMANLLDSLPLNHSAELKSDGELSITVCGSDD